MKSDELILKTYVQARKIANKLYYWSAQCDDLFERQKVLSLAGDFNAISKKILNQFIEVQEDVPKDIMNCTQRRKRNIRP